MPARFDSLGVSFQYPDNWRLDDSDAILGRRSVTVYSPGGAFWSLSIHSGTLEPAKLAGAVVDAMRQEYDSLEAEETEESVAGIELFGYDMAFYCLDLTNTAHIRTVHFAYNTYAIYCQAEDREYGQVARVFHAMTYALLSSLNASGGGD
jgi:hypothetical protein